MQAARFWSSSCGFESYSLSFAVTASAEVSLVTTLCWDQHPVTAPTSVVESLRPMSYHRPPFTKGGHTLPTKVKEIRPMTEQGRKTDSTCSVCGTLPKDRIREDRVWEFAKAYPGPVNPFKRAVASG